MRYKTPSAVFAVFIKNSQVLLQKRNNIRYADGMYDFAVSGHVEKNESMMTTLIRECKEELGIDINKKNIEFGTFIHKRDQSIVYCNVYFLVRGDDDFKINEPEKCSELKWFYIKDLPEELIEDRRIALENMIHKITYSEMGWNDFMS